MPLYEYTCKDCGKRFEELVRSANALPGQCPACGSKNLAKGFSTFAAAATSSSSGRACDFGMGGGGHCCSGPGCCGS